MRSLILLVALVPNFVFTMDDVEMQIAALEAGDNSSASSGTLQADHEQLANQALEFAHYRGRPMVDDENSDEDAVPVRRKSYSEIVQETKHRVRKRARQQSTHRRKNITSSKGHVEGLDDLEQGVGIVSDPSNELTVEQVNDVLCNQLNGKTLHGFGRFDLASEEQRKGMLGMLQLLKITDPEQYTSIAGSIVRGKKSKQQNKALIMVLNRVVDSIDSMNADSSRLATEGNQIAIDSLKEEIRAHKRVESRYRWGIAWTVIGGTVTLVATNVINYVVNQVSPEELEDLCDQMGNITMS